MVRKDRALEALLGRRVEVTAFVPTDLGPVGPIRSDGQIRRVLGIVTKERRYSKAIVELDEPMRSAGGIEARLISAASQSYLDNLDTLTIRGRLPVVFAAEAKWVLECQDDDPRLASETDSVYIGFGGIHLTS